MRSARCLIVLACLLLPVTGFAGIGDGDLPAASTWYFHADFDEMRSSDAGKGLWAWLEREVLADIRDEAGVDLAREADRITAYATPDDGAVLVLEGRLSQETRDKALAVAAAAERFEILESGGRTFYHVVGDGGLETDKLQVDGLGREIYFSFDVRNRLLAATDRMQMEALLQSGGKVPGSKSHGGALFVLTAEKSLVQAGMNTDEIGDDDGGFDSNILRNTKQVALMVADVAGNIAIEAQLLANEPQLAESLASIVRGLIALQAFSGDMDPDIVNVLKGTRVDVNESLLKISIALAPDILAAMLEEA